MARTNNLTNFLTDVATAIKTKTGDSSLIPASQFDTKIANITTGHLDNTEYQEANDDLDDILEGTEPATIYPPDWSELGYEDTPQDILDAFNEAKAVYDNWDSSITSMLDMFKGDNGITICPKIDTSNVINMNSTFYSSKLAIIPVLDTRNVTMLYNTFYRCTSLNPASLNNIMQMCINATNYTRTKTLKEIGLTQAQSITCQSLSNYQDLINAGWTTGY